MITVCEYGVSSLGADITHLANWQKYGTDARLKLPASHQRQIFSQGK